MNFLFQKIKNKINLYKLLINLFKVLINHNYQETKHNNSIINLKKVQIKI